MQSNTLDSATVATVGRMEEYYAKRAHRYDRAIAYRRPKAAAHFSAMKAQLQIAMYGHDVLEVACGTGCWTEAVSHTARSIVATDRSEEMLAVAREKVGTFPHVRLQIADAYSLQDVPGTFDAAFAGYWWSHIPVARIADFLGSLHSKLQPGSPVVFMDDLKNEGRKFRASDSGDALRRRTLDADEEYTIIKNAPSRQELLTALAGVADEIAYAQYPIGECAYWVVTYKTKR